MTNNMEKYSDYRHKLGYYTLPGIMYEIPNPNDLEKLDKLISKDQLYNDTNSCGFGFILNEDGSVKSDVNYYKFQDRQLISCTYDVSENLDKLGIAYNLISDKEVIVQVEGYASSKFASMFYEYDIMALQFTHMVTASIPNIDGPVYMARMGYTGEYGFQFILNKEDLLEFETNYLQKAQAKAINHDVIDYTSFEMLQPVNSIIQKNKQYSLSDLNYGWNLDFLKDDFQGKGAAKEQALNSKVLSIGFRTTADNLSVGDSIYFDKKCIGKILVLFKSLDTDNPGFLGSAIVEKKYACSGITFATDKGALKTISAPYVVPVSWSDRVEKSGGGIES